MTIIDLPTGRPPLALPWRCHEPRRAEFPRLLDVKKSCDVITQGHVDPVVKDMFGTLRFRHGSTPYAWFDTFRSQHGLTP